jgi:uncharacterized protein involved in type VI secretion and phage assembly
MSPKVTATDPKRPNQLAGVYRAVVVDNQDPERLGRVRVRVPAMSSSKCDDIWARVAAPRAGAQRGTWVIPDVDDEVLVAFEAGDLRQAYVVGSLWNSTDALPEQMTSGNPVMSIVSAAGSRITIDDRQDQVSVRLETPGGRSVTLRDSNSTIVIDDSSGSAISLTPAGVDIVAPGRLRVTTTTAEITATMIRLETGMTRATGVVQCDTLIANSVVAASYTPGAGNIW